VTKTTGKQREKRPGGITGKGFLPGPSGNPQGRPRTAKFSDAARRLTEEIGQNGKTGAEQLAEHCFRCALKGSARHAELFLAYTEGKPKQCVELSGPNGDTGKVSAGEKEMIRQEKVDPGRLAGISACTPGRSPEGLAKETVRSFDGLCR